MVTGDREGNLLLEKFRHVQICINKYLKDYFNFSHGGWGGWGGWGGDGGGGGHGGEGGWGWGGWGGWGKGINLSANIFKLVFLF